MTDDWRVVLDRYLAGECSPEEAAIVQQSLAADPDRAAWAALLEQARDRSGRVASGTDARAALDRVRARIAQAPTPTSARAESSARRDIGPPRLAGASRHPRPWGAGGRHAWRVAAVAASVVVALGIGVTIGVGRQGAGFSAAPGREYTTAAGQRLSITLVDGTRLTLAPATRVRVAADYGRSARARGVELEGEAYFVVVHDAAHPFMVRALGAVAQDIGTAFDVQAYPADTAVRVAVAEGRVSVHAVAPAKGGASTPAGEAQAGDVATVANGAVGVEHGADVASLTGWTKGELMFRGVPLGAVLAELGRWYDIDFRLTDSSLAGQQLTATVNTQSVDQVLRDIVSALGVRCERRGRVVTVSAQGM